MVAVNTINFSPVRVFVPELAAIQLRGKSRSRKNDRRVHCRVSTNATGNRDGRSTRFSCVRQWWGGCYLVCGLQLRKYTLSETFRRRTRVGQPFLRTPAQVGLPVVEGRPGRTRGRTAGAVEQAGAPSREHGRRGAGTQKSACNRETGVGTIVEGKPTIVKIESVKCKLHPALFV